VKKNVVVQKKFKVNGQLYDSLDQVPTEFRAALESALKPGTPAKTTITINGKSYASLDEVPAPLRLLLRGVTAMATRAVQEAAGPSSGTTSPAAPAIEGTSPEAGILRPEPVLSMKKVLVFLGLAVLLVWLARSLF
jgi:hypothetical protein